MLEKNERSAEEIELKVLGALSGAQAEEFQRELQSLAVGAHKLITLNLAEVPSITSSCIGKMLMIRKALAGQETPQKALDGVAEEWRQIVERMGKDNVRDAYRNVVALEDNLR